MDDAPEARPAIADSITINGLDRLAVRSELEVVIDSAKTGSLKGLAALHTVEEVRMLQQGGVPRFLAGQVSDRSVPERV